MKAHDIADQMLVWKILQESKSRHKYLRRPLISRNVTRCMRTSTANDQAQHTCNLWQETQQKLSLTPALLQTILFLDMPSSRSGNSKHFRCFCTDDVTVLCGVRSFFCWNVLPRNVWGVWFAICWQTLGDANARAIKFTNNPLLIRDFDGFPALSEGRIDHISSPPQRNRLIWKLKCFHQLRQIFIDHFLAKRLQVARNCFLLMCTLFHLLLPFVRCTTVVVSVGTLLLLYICCELPM